VSRPRLFVVRGPTPSAAARGLRSILLLRVADPVAALLGPGADRQRAPRSPRGRGDPHRRLVLGLAEAVKRGEISAQARVLFLHTGGLPGLLAQGESLREAIAR